MYTAAIEILTVSSFRCKLEFSCRPQIFRLFRSTELLVLKIYWLTKPTLFMIQCVYVFFSKLAEKLSEAYITLFFKFPVNFGFSWIYSLLISCNPKRPKRSKIGDISWVGSSPKHARRKTIWVIFFSYIGILWCHYDDLNEKLSNYLQPRMKLQLLFHQSNGKVISLSKGLFTGSITVEGLIIVTGGDVTGFLYCSPGWNIFDIHVYRLPSPRAMFIHIYGTGNDTSRYCRYPMPYYSFYCKQMLILHRLDIDLPALYIQRVSYLN